MTEVQRQFRRLLDLARAGDASAASEFERRFREPLTQLVRRRIAARAQNHPAWRALSANQTALETVVRKLIAALTAPAADPAQSSADSAFASSLLGEETRLAKLEWDTVTAG